MLLTASWGLPLAGGILLLLIPNRDGSRNGVDPLAGARDLGRRVRADARHLAALRSEFRRLPVCRARAVDTGLRHRLLPRHRRHQPAPGRADRVPDADRAALVLGEHREEGEGVLRLHPRARGGDDRRLHLARPVPLLRVLGRDAHPDVLPHRDLGLRPAHLRGHQVHALHDGRQRADAGRHPGAGLHAQRVAGRRLHVRPAQAVRPRDPRGDADLAVPGVRGGVRDQGAALPVPHLAARCARAGADGRLDHPGRRAAQDGHLRAGAVRVPAVPGGGGDVRALDRAARRHRHHLRRAGGDGAAGHEEAGGLLLGEPSWLRRARHLRDERAGHAGRGLSDARARHQHRRPLPASSACSRTAGTRASSPSSAG